MDLDEKRAGVGTGSIKYHTRITAWQSEQHRLETLNHERMKGPIHPVFTRGRFGHHRYFRHRDNLEDEPEELICLPLLKRPFAPRKDATELGPICMAGMDNPSGQPAQILGLCLVRTGQKPNEFRRIGLCEFTGDGNSWEETVELLKFWDADETVISIV